MKRPPVRRLAVLLLASATACSDAPFAALSELQEDPLLARVAALGFRTDDVRDFGDHVLVEGDIRLTKEQLRAAPLPTSGGPMGPLFQYRTTVLVGSPKIHQIRVSLSDLSAHPDWQAAAREAFTHWSGISNSYVRIVEGTPADITVGTYCTDPGIGASAELASAGNPGRFIVVNLCYGQTRNHSQQVSTMVHELGHSIGFRHSNYQQMGDAVQPLGAMHVPGTPTSGNATGSVMNGGTPSATWAGFASSDLLATQTLYPLPQVSASIAYPSGNPSLSWGSVAASLYRVHFIVERYYIGIGTFQVDEYFVTNTTGTTAGDPNRGYTGEEMCEIRGTHQGGVEEFYYYRIRADFPTGQTTHLIPAAVGDC